MAKVKRRNKKRSIHLCVCETCTTEGRRQTSITQRLRGLTRKLEDAAAEIMDSVNSGQHQAVPHYLHCARMSTQNYPRETRSAFPSSGSVINVVQPRLTHRPRACGAARMLLMVPA
ncbi:hypothetical protein CBL_08191 [Carabus blaptoides fortunei]